ncbi:hypothetical protein [Amphritea balenae]|uniref:Uncharacterized protein n=1 Tax=Amphritea balenae TaxID=452629 RepID=A0A3P1SWW4_9GAMM|nr:hypothetical protein [Amphritea balenae]RRD01732.1 hypothetical protein EHS89_04065 [Amphritea balenae]GGK54543.1 hypothetical protein GCM10007941_00740 [Amphritea balenae]
MESDISEENTCAGKPIKAAMIPFSGDFLHGCKKFAELARSSENEQDIRIFNSSSIINAACFLEARINEEISIGVLCYGFEEDSPESKEWSTIQNLQKKLTVQEKWDLVSLRTNGALWDKGREPFQSFEIISSLRNELVHFKGEFLGKDEAPNKKIAGLMKSFGVSSSATWIEDDCSSWVSDLLNSKELSVWVKNSISNFEQSYYDLRNPKT